ncbi:MAG: YifB family Mg chelatase-like AAA ATPase [Leptospiraceae bacterium]|nr:YifB family Mg chelatase-like AAA ATPase [Leptospiraceae bacterium]
MNENYSGMTYTYSADLEGLNSRIIKIEVNIKRGIPRFLLVGLATASVRESSERVRIAIENSGFEFPLQNILVNLSPAGIKKDSSWFDLPIAVSILFLSGQIQFNEPMDNFLFLGELGLDGKIKPMKGIVNILSGLLSSDFQKIVLPYENRLESIFSGKKIYPIQNLSEINEIFSGERSPYVHTISKKPPAQNIKDIECFPSQYLSIRKLMISLAGRHHLLLVGSPGNGKTMISNLSKQLAPELRDSEYIDVLKIKSLQEHLFSESSFQLNRPFRSPHHTSSDISITGGGKTISAGEVTLAHRGILFLDELCEFKSSVIQSLREPMEEGSITISRANYHLTYPASFLLIAATNPCPCGFLFSRNQACICSAEKIRKYLSKISGPFLDRIDIQDILEPGESEKNKKMTLSLSDIQSKIEKASRRQEERFKNKIIHYNGEIHINPEEYIEFDVQSKTVLNEIKNQKGISIRKFFKIQKISRTIADLDDSDTIREEHVLEAYQINKTFLSEYYQK